MVDTIFADVAQPDQARIVSLNSHYFLKNGGHVVVSVKASCIDSTAAPEAVFQKEVIYMHMALPFPPPPIPPSLPFLRLFIFRLGLGAISALKKFRDTFRFTHPPLLPPSLTPIR